MKKEFRQRPKYDVVKLAHKKGSSKHGIVKFVNIHKEKLRFFDFRYDFRASSYRYSRNTKGDILKFRNNKFVLFNVDRMNYSGHWFDFGLTLNKGKKKLENKPAQKRTLKILKDFSSKYGIEYETKDPNQYLRWMCYPLLSKVVPEYKLDIKEINGTLCKNIRRGKDFKHLIRLCYGNDGKVITKNIVQWMEQNKNLNIIYFSFIKNKLSVDHIQAFLKEINQRNVIRMVPTAFKENARIFKVLNENQRKKLIFDEDFINQHFNFFDCGRMFIKVRQLPDKFSSWRDLHDKLMGMYDAIQHLPVELEVKNLLYLDKKDVGGLEIVIPKMSTDLKIWGKHMHNCIYGYTDAINSKQCKILGVEKNGEIAYNIEIRSKKLNQFYGKCNKHVPKDDFEKVYKVLENEKLITCSQDDYRFVEAI